MKNHGTLCANGECKKEPQQKEVNKKKQLTKNISILKCFSGDAGIDSGGLWPSRDPRNRRMNAQKTAEEQRAARQTKTTTTLSFRSNDVYIRSGQTLCQGKQVWQCKYLHRRDVTIAIHKNGKERKISFFPMPFLWNVIVMSQQPSIRIGIVCLFRSKNIVNTGQSYARILMS